MAASASHGTVILQVPVVRRPEPRPERFRRANVEPLVSSRHSITPVCSFSVVGADVHDRLAAPGGRASQDPLG